MSLYRRIWRKSCLAISLCASTLSGYAFGAQYSPGASDTEIVIGNTGPYTGPLVTYAAINYTMGAYMNKVNDEGGVNGRKIVWITKDDAYSPPKTVELVRRFVEQDHVLAILGLLGTPTNVAVRAYLNERKIPQLAAISGSGTLNKPKEFPWSMGWAPSYEAEAQMYVDYVTKNYPHAKIGILYQNDDFGKSYFGTLQEGLKSNIVKVVSYNTTDPTIDSQILQLKASGADLLIDICVVKFAIQAIKKLDELNWKPVHIMSNPGAYIETTFKVAGLEKSKGIITMQFLKNVPDPKYKDDQGVKDYFAFMQKYQPKANANDLVNCYGYSVAQTMIQWLKMCEDNLTRENLLHQATNSDFTLPLLLPPAKIMTSPTDYSVVRNASLVRFDGQWFEKID
jgi:branched-chain amino acid transport system substrate-binding protein